MNIMFARLLTPAEYGQFVVLQVITMGLGIFASAGMTNTYMKLVAELDQLYGAYELTKTCLKMLNRNLLMSIVAYILISIFLFHSEKVIFIHLFWMFGLNLVCQAFMFIVIAWYRAINKAYISSFAEQGIVAAATVVLTVSWLQVIAEPLTLLRISFLYTLANVCILIIFSALLIKKIREHKYEHITIDEKRVAKLSRHFLTMQTLNYISHWGGILLVGLMLSAEQVANLSVSQRLAQVVTFFLLAFNGVVAPKFANLNSTDDEKGLKKLAQKSSIILTSATLPLTLLLLFFGEHLLSLFGNQYIDAYHLLFILVIGQIFNTITGPVAVLLNMTNHEKNQRNIVIFYSAATIISLPPLTLVWSVSGAAIVTSTGLILSNLTSAFLVYKYLGFVTVPGLQWITKKSSS